MKIILKSIKQLLSEGRIQDIKNKFPNVDPDIIDFFVKNDPSRNQKYLEWMVKAINHLPTVQYINRQILGYNGEDYEPNIKTANEILKKVREFHELQPYLVYTKDGKREGTTDLYKYKFTDNEMIYHLNFDIIKAKKRRYEREKEKKEKKFKKQADKIYEDKNWLVVRPISWEASCIYGAGTRWCTTSKNSDRHFKRETKRKLLIYVINKNLDINNASYKVAWQISYVRDLSKILTNTSVDLSEVKFWDAEDNSMGKYPNFTIETYLSSIPQVIKTAIINYAQKVMDEFYNSDIAYSDDPKIQALIEYLRITPENINKLEELPWTDYGMKVYQYDGNGYIVSTKNEVEYAKILYTQEFIYMNGIDECIEILGKWEKYIYINNPKIIADEMADSYVSDLSDNEILEEAKNLIKKPHMKGIEELLEDYLISSGVETDLEEDREDLNRKLQNEEITISEYKIELEKIHQEAKELAKYLKKRLDQIKDKLRTHYFIKELEYIEDDPIGWLEEYGWWVDDKPIEQAFNIISIDEDRVKEDFKDGIDIENFSSTGNYDTVTVKGERYYIFHIDI